MSKKRYDLFHGGKSYSEKAQTNNELSRFWKSVLRKIHNENGYLTCACSPKNKPRISVSLRNNEYYVSRFPKTGILHSKDCVFYSDFYSQSLSFRKKVIEETINGDYKIRLEEKLINRPKMVSDGNSLPKKGKSGVSKTPITLLGLLRFLWEESQLNHWPGKGYGHNIDNFHKVIRGVAKKVRIQDFLLDDVLVLPTRIHGNLREDSITRKKRASQLNSGLIVIGEISEWPNMLKKSPLKLIGFRDFPAININYELFKKANDSSPMCKNFFQVDNVRVIAIVQTTEPRSNNFVDMKSIALMPVSKQWIPFDSSYERRLESKLVSEGRAFFKPLRFDSTTDWALPDFVLSDVTPNMPLEVFGMETEVYMKRRDEKTRKYDEEFGPDGWWFWDAASSPTVIPQLPPKI